MEFLMTKKGKELQANLVAGATLIFTKAEGGTGYSNTPEDLLTIQGLKQNLQLDEIEFKKDEGKTKLLLTLSNLSNNTEYTLKQIGIYAKTSDTEEILYCIGQDVIGERVPAISEKEISYEYTLFFAFDNAYQITLDVSDNDFVKIAKYTADIKSIQEPIFDDSGKVSEISSFDVFMSKFASKVNISKLFAYLKTAFKYVLNKDQLINNCITDRADLPLAASQGKALNDEIKKNTKVRTIILRAANWQNDNNTFLQAVSVEGVSENDIPIGSPVIPKAENKEYKKSAECIDGFNTANGSITFYCNKKRPTTDVTVMLKGV